MFRAVPTVGMRAWAVDSLRAPLPNGLPNRTPVTIAKIRQLEQGAQAISVVDQTGRLWQLCPTQVDGGQLIPINGRHCRETEPEGILYLQQALREVESRIRREREELGGSPSWWEPDRAELRWYLDRNGNNPDSTDEALTGRAHRSREGPLG